MAGAAMEQFTDAPIQLVKLGKHRVAYFDVGRGPPLVLVHGWPQHSYCWRHLAARLSDAYRVIALDLPGCGDSDVVSEGFDKKSLAARIKDLIDHLQLAQVTIVGHDWGGPIAYRVTLDYPESTSGIIVLNGRMPLLESATTLMYTPQQVRERWYFNFNLIPELPEKMIGRSLRDYLSHVFYHWSGDRHVHSPRDLGEHLRVLSRPNGLRAGLGLYRTSGVPDTEDWQALAKSRITIPHLVLWGILDPILPTEYISGLEMIAPNLTVELHPKAGHFLAEDDPDWVAERIRRFLA